MVVGPSPTTILIMNELRVRIAARFFFCVSDFLISLHFTSCHHEFPDKNLRGIDGLLRFFLHIANRGRLMRQEKLLTGQDICDLMLILSNVPAS